MFPYSPEVKIKIFYQIANFYTSRSEYTCLKYYCISKCFKENFTLFKEIYFNVRFLAVKY